MDEKRIEKILRLVDEKGFLRPRDAEAMGISRRELVRLREAGLLEQPARGLYVRAERSLSEGASMAAAAVMVPRGVICLLSALEFHQLGSQAPHQVWMAIESNDWRPAPGRLPLRIVRFSGAAFREGIEEHVVEGVRVRVYCPAKTVADCFKYRNKVGLDVALEALRDCWRQRRCSTEELLRFAEVCRVSQVVRPYLESLS